MGKETELLNTFECHGFEEAGRSGDEAYGSCPLCDDGKKFYVNAESGQWDCKKCGEGGNVVTFLEKIHALHLEETTKSDYSRLAKDRGISISTFTRNQLAWTGTEWLIPARNHQGRIHDLRRWDPGDAADQNP